MTPGMSVEPGFTLPWSDRAMADVWAGERAEFLRIKAQRTAARAKPESHTAKIPFAGAEA